MADCGWLMMIGVAKSEPETPWLEMVKVPPRTSALVSFSARAFSGDTSRLDRVSGAQDDLSGAGSVRQRGWGLNASYRLSPRASASLGYTRTTTADAGNQPGNDQQSASFTLSQQLAQRATLSLTLRHTAFDSVLRPYEENAAVLLLSLRF